MLVTFAKGQFQALKQRGVVLVLMQQPSDKAEEVRYLSYEALRDAGLLEDNGGQSIAQGVSRALAQYEPLTQLILLFLYEKTTSIYLLNYSDLQLP